MTNLPFTETTNLYCGIYDHEGKQLVKELFYVENGVVSGHFKISSDFGLGEFYIKAHTNWMKNFKEEDAFVQKIYIINQLVVSKRPNITNNQYNIQLFPEGGHIVIGITNTIGFRITNKNGNGLRVINGKVMNTHGEILVNNITSNIYGIGKFNFKYLKDNKYYINLEVAGGRNITKEIPSAQNKGISLSVNNLLDNKLVVSLRTNDETLSSIRGKDFYLAIHRDGLMAFHNFRFNERENKIYLNKDELWPGVNTITLFNNKLIPIAERLFYNENNINVETVSVEIDKSIVLKDSTRVKIKLFFKENTSAQLSVSILPEQTKVKNTDRSIKSSFLLNPYIKSTVENPAYYFRDMNRKKLYELDMLLLTQGWSRYNWKDIFNNPPKEIYSFEKGIRIKGKLENIINGWDNKMAIYHQDIKGMKIAVIDGSNNFSVENMYLIKNDSINVTLMNGKSEMIKPRADLVFSPIIENDSILPQKNIEQNPLPENIQNKDGNLNLIIENSTIALDTVMLSGKSKENKLTRNLGLTVGVYEGVKITEKVMRKYFFISDLIRKLGFRVSANPVNSTFSILSKVTACPPPIVYLNDFKVSSIDIDNFPLVGVDEIYYEQFGLEGSCGGTIYIYRQNGSRPGPKNENFFTKVLVEQGFKRPSEYYNPRYNINHNREDFLEYGTIHWEPNLDINANSVVEITFADLGVKKVKIFIEGMSLDGSLISEIKTLNLE